jgi:hypothetical protein
MKTKQLLIALGILIVVVIAWLILKTKNVVAPAPAVTQTTIPAAGTTAATSTPKRTPVVSASLPIIKLLGGQNGKTTMLVIGQKMTVTVSDPAAGYTIDPLQYDSAVLVLNAHTHAGPANSYVTGTDTWEFTAIKTGTTGLSITATPGANKNSTIILFTNAVSVK